MLQKRQYRPSVQKSHLMLVCKSLKSLLLQTLCSKRLHPLGHIHKSKESVCSMAISLYSQLGHCWPSCTCASQNSPWSGRFDGERAECRAAHSCATGRQVAWASGTSLRRRPDEQTVDGSVPPCRRRSCATHLAGVHVSWLERLHCSGRRARRSLAGTADEIE
jgi:hypothetical protein